MKSAVLILCLLQKDGADSLVTNPLMKLLVLFQGPSKLIEKRQDKRLDYDSAQIKYEKNKEDKIVSHVTFTQLAFNNIPACL